MRAADLYGSSSLQLEDKEEDEDDPFGLSEAWVALMVWLYSKGEFAPGMITATEVQDFVKGHTEVLNEAVDFGIKQEPLDNASRQRLQESNYVFSGIKTFHELNEALPSLLTPEGNIKPFNQFLNDVQTINKNYNSYYLRSEYNFAKASAEMAAKWKNFMMLDSDRYYLQYRTAADEHVRRSHRLLHNVTLPITSKFWDYYFPPNGWNCRCNVVPVRKSDYPLSDEKKAMQDGSQATYGKHQEMFKFNPGKVMATFPAYNAYTISKCQKCKDNGYLKLVADVPDNELCRACRIYRECAGDYTKSQAAIERKHYLHEMETLLCNKIEKIIEGKTIKIGFNKYGNEHLYSDTFKRTAGFLNKSDLKDLDSVLKKGNNGREVPLYKNRHDGIENFLYFDSEINGKKVTLNVAVRAKKSKDGKIRKERFLYSVTKRK